MKIKLSNCGNNPKGIVIEAKRSGDKGIYDELAIEAKADGKSVADILIGLNTDGELRIVVTANSKKDSDDFITAIFPCRSADRMIDKA